MGGCGVSDSGAISRAGDGCLAAPEFAVGPRGRSAAAKDAILQEVAPATWGDRKTEWATITRNSLYFRLRAK